MKKVYTLVVALCLTFGCLPVQGQINTLPPGLTLNSNGSITGTPTTVGTYRFGVKVCDSETPPQCVTANVGISVYGAMAIVPNHVVMPVAFVDSSYNVQLHVIGGTGSFTWSLP